MNPDFFLALPVLLFSVVVHEVAHAVAALRQGDATAYDLGRITLNPTKHIDPFMSIVMPIMLWVGSGGQFLFGAAKPVPVNPRNYRNYRRGDIIVSSAGVAANLVLAVMCTLFFAGFGLLGNVAVSLAPALALLQRSMFWGIWLNLVLAVFNLIPIPPLDGSHIMYHLLPPRAGAWYRRVQRFGFVPLLLLLLFFRPALSLLLAPATFLFGLALTAVGGLAISPQSLPL